MKVTTSSEADQVVAFDYDEHHDDRDRYDFTCDDDWSDADDEPTGLLHAEVVR